MKVKKDKLCIFIFTAAFDHIYNIDANISEQHCVDKSMVKTYMGY